MPRLPQVTRQGRRWMVAGNQIADDAVKGSTAVNTPVLVMRRRRLNWPSAATGSTRSSAQKSIRLQPARSTKTLIRYSIEGGGGCAVVAARLQVPERRAATPDPTA